jgi:MoaA/NifB/PqqE/SkfB family radical SAM enzyme
MSDGPYSTMKAGWHIDRIKDIRDGKQAVPVELQIILSDLCNHDCYWCAYRSSEGLSAEKFVVIEADGKRNHNPNRMIPFDKAIEILDDAAMLGVKSIIFTGGGEPTVHPQHLEIFQHALDLGLECSLNTNGDLLRDGWKDVLPLFAYIRVSVDAGTDEEYAKTRRVPAGRYDKVLRNLAAMAAAVKEKGTACIVGTGYVVTPDNWVNLPLGVGRLAATGARYVRLASMQSTKGLEAYPGGTWGAAREAAHRAKAIYGTENFDVVDLMEAAMGKQMDDPFCGFQQFVLYIGGNQKVYRCCYVAYSDLGDIGDLSERSFKDWFLSPEKAEKIDMFDARACTTCPLADKNKTIAYMVGTPTHVNFV